MNPKQQAFVCEMLRHGNKAEAYRAAYKPLSDNPRSIESAANRLMKNSEVAEAIQTVQNRIYAEVQQELKASMLREALTVQRKREILAQIAEGEWMIQPPPEDIAGKPTAVLIPTLKERLKAIDMDNRMAGTYANAKPVEPQAEEPEKHNKTQQSTEDPNSEVLPEICSFETELNEPAPAPAYKKHPFIMPVINSHDPLLNRAPDNFFKPQIRGIEKLLPAKPAWMQTIRV